MKNHETPTFSCSIFHFYPKIFKNNLIFKNVIIVRNVLVFRLFPVVFSFILPTTAVQTVHYQNNNKQAHTYHYHVYHRPENRRINNHFYLRNRKNRLVGSKSYLAAKVSWQQKLVGSKSQLATKVSWQQKLVGSKSQLAAKVSWQQKLVGSKSQLAANLATVNLLYSTKCCLICSKSQIIAKYAIFSI